MPDIEDFIKAPVRVRGHTLEDFQTGAVFEHHWGRTITEQDAVLFATCFLQYNAIYFNQKAA